MSSKFNLLRILMLSMGCLVLGISPIYAQDNSLAGWSKQVIEAKTHQDLYAPFEAIKDFYFKNNKYSDFVDYLKSLAQKKKSAEPFVNYYRALARYQHLKYLEEKQLWDEYFSQGNAYRDELTQGSQKAIAATVVQEPLHIYARLLLWQFHKNQQDSFEEAAFSELMASAIEYSAVATDFKPIKEVADKFFAYGEKGKSKEFYKIYAQKLITSDISDKDLANAASKFYQEGNPDLAENIYDVYIDRVSKKLSKEEFVRVLAEIAKAFAYKDEGPSDPFYAEKIFKRLEDKAGKEAFDQELMYLRGFNLEKAKEYLEAKVVFDSLALRFPKAPHHDEIIFKAGLISAYVLRDTVKGKEYFEKLAQREKNFTAQAVSALYQLGLLSQWEEELTAARDYYNRLLDVAAGNFADTVALAKERLKEIEASKPIEYNLKTFLDLSLKKENALYDMSKIDLRSQPYQAKRRQSVSVDSTAHTAPTGCMQIELQYFWSGHLGKAQTPLASQSAFETSYTFSGTKEINLVVISPTGIIDRSLDIVDAY
ncbi:MAG: hypothetical protein V1923_03100 [Candidatus Omnitrophota bacterium]